MFQRPFIGQAQPHVVTLVAVLVVLALGFNGLSSAKLNHTRDLSRICCRADSKFQRPFIGQAQPHRNIAILLAYPFPSLFQRPFIGQAQPHSSFCCLIPSKSKENVSTAFHRPSSTTRAAGTVLARPSGPSFNGLSSAKLNHTCRGCNKRCIRNGTSLENSGTFLTNGRINCASTNVAFQRPFIGQAQPHV